MFADYGRDVVHAIRRLRGAPFFTVVSVLSLGIGIGGTTAVYAVIRSLLLTPPAITRIEEVVNIYHWNPNWGRATPSNLALSRADYRDLKTDQRSFQALTSWKPFRHTLTSGRATSMVFGEMVEGNYFRTLGIHATLGRTIGIEDDIAASTPVVVLSHSLWRHRFGGRASVIGETVKIGPVKFVVVGVASPHFKGVFAPSLAPTPLWIPLSTRALLEPSTAGATRERRELFVKARLRPGLSEATASAEVVTIAKGLDSEHPLQHHLGAQPTGPDPRRDRAWHIMPAGSVYLHESVHVYARALMLAVQAIMALVLLVACTNIANLLMARGASRRHELAVRRALGATRGALIRTCLSESGVLIAGGVISAAVFTRLLIDVFSFSVPVTHTLTTEISPHVDRPVLIVAAICTIWAFVVFGVMPAIRLTMGRLFLPSSRRSWGSWQRMTHGS